MPSSGFVRLKLLKINASKQWIVDNYDPELEEEPIYTYTTDDGIKGINLDMYFQDSEERIFKHTIQVEEDIVQSKQGAYLYVNSIGDTQFAKNDQALWSSFIAWQRINSWILNGQVVQKYQPGAKPNQKDIEVIEDKEFRQSVKGEAELLYYTKPFYNHNDYDQTVNILPKVSNILKGRSKYLENLITDQPSDITGFVYVNKGKEILYKHFLPRSFMVWINSGMKNGALDKGLQKQYKSFLEHVDYDLQGLDYQLEKYGPLQNIRPIITETNAEY